MKEKEWLYRIDYFAEVVKIVVVEKGCNITKEKQ